MKCQTPPQNLYAIPHCSHSKMTTEVWTTFFEKTSSPYHDHRLSPGEVRLVTLQPGAWSDDIRCDLQGELLRNKPKFEAVSYVWGSPKNTRSITLNGQSHTATINLDSLLRRLRHPEYAKTLWVDALCIDQSNATERTHQVHLMGEIYKAASRVVVFLGDGVDRGSKRRRSSKVPAFLAPAEFTGHEADSQYIEHCIRQIRDCTEHELMRRFEKDVCDFVAAFCVIRTLAQDDHLVDIAWKLKEQLGQQAEDGMVYLFEMLRRFSRGPWTPWWERIWVVQEVAFPKNVTVVYGHVSAQWEMIAAAARNYMRHSSSCCSDPGASFPRDQSIVLADYSRRVLDIEHLRSTIADEPIPAQLFRSWGSNQRPLSAGSGKFEKRTLMSLLRRFRARKSSDARDKIYALLSLIQYEPGQSAMAPDYTIDAIEVFKRATMESIYNTGTLSVLPTELGPKYRNDLPSWVPDWDAPEGHTHRSWIEAAALYDVCTKYPLNDNTVQNVGDTLQVRGVSVGEINSVQNVMWADNDDVVRNTILYWWCWIIYKYGSMQLLNFWKILCADIICSTSSNAMPTEYRRSRPEDELRFVLWALNAEKSPFREPIPTGLWNGLLSEHFREAREQKKRLHGQHLLMELLSEHGRSWCRFLLLQDRVRNNNEPRMCDAVLEFFPDKRERDVMAKELVEEVGLPASEKEGWLQALSIDLASIRLRINDLEESQRDYIREGRADEYREKLHGLHSLRRASESAWGKATWNKVLHYFENWIESRYKCGSMKSLQPQNLEVVTMDRSIMSATLSRRLFTTHHGLVGLAPADADINDTVVLIQGGRTPFLLRGKNGRQIRRFENILSIEAEPHKERHMTTTAENAIHLSLQPNCLEWLERHYDESEMEFKSKVRVEWELIGELYAHLLVDANSLGKDGELAASSLGTSPQNREPREREWKNIHII